MFYQCKNTTQIANACGAIIPRTKKAVGKKAGAKLMFGPRFGENDDFHDTVADLKKLYYDTTKESRVPQPKHVAGPQRRFRQSRQAHKTVGGKDTLLLCAQGTWRARERRCRQAA